MSLDLLSVPESKVSIIKVIRSVLRENVRRNMKGEAPLERSCKEHLAPLRGTRPSCARLGGLMLQDLGGFLQKHSFFLLCDARLAPLYKSSLFSSDNGLPSPPLFPGSSRASWLCKQPLGEFSPQAETPKLGPDSDEGSLSSGTYSLSGAPPARASSASPLFPGQQSRPRGSTSQPRPTSVKESDILSDEDDDGFSEGGLRRDSGDSSSPTSAIEAQFLQLQLSEDATAPRVQPEGAGDTPEIQPKLVRGHFSAVKRKPCSFRRSQGALLGMKEQSRSLDSQTDAALSDLNALLDREFSVQSLTSVVNEDCFYDPAESCASDSGAAASCQGSA